MTFDIRYTRLARAFLGDKINAFEEQFRGSVQELVHDEDEPDAEIDLDFLLHSFEWNDQLFVANGRGDHLLVDTATYVEGPMVNEGPLKGKRMMFPQADSEDGE